MAQKKGNTGVAGMRAALYLRVSSNEQKLDNQLPALEAYAASRGWTIAGTYTEQESAWRAGHQKELAKLLKELRNGSRYDILLCWALDRLSRQGAASILNLVATLKAYGCRVISLEEPWTELPGELGEVLYAIAGWVARMESERRSERTKLGLARAIKEGKRLGRPQGAKDKKGRRRKSGYHLRWAGKQTSGENGGDTVKENLHNRSGKTKERF